MYNKNHLVIMFLQSRADVRVDSSPLIGYLPKDTTVQFDYEEREITFLLHTHVP